MTGGAIKRNCNNCVHLSSDDCGGDFPSDSWPICNLDKPKANLKSFPFKKEQDCHHPDFWAYLNQDAELRKSFDSEVEVDFGIPKTFAKFKEKYITQPTTQETP